MVGLLAGRSLALADDALLELGLGLFLMDVGKLALPPAIVEKHGPLDEAECELMRRHPRYGLDLLRDEDLGPEARTVVRFHHERWDGAGYPAGLAGEEIPRFARIAALADAFAAEASQAAGLAVLHAGAGRAFDPELVEAFEEVATARSAGLALTA